MRVRSLSLVGSLVVSLAAGCGAPRMAFDAGGDSGAHPDGTATDTGTLDTGTADARDSGRTDSGRDVAADRSTTDTGPADTGRTDTGVDATMRDVNPPRDVPMPTDTGGGVCNTCTTDNECAGTCGDPGAGSSWCCVDGICTFESVSTCAAPPPDGGGGGDGFSFGDGGDCSFQPCTTDNDCCSSASCCSQAFGACIDPAIFGGQCF